MDRYRTIANPRELDPSFSVPCKRCAGLLQEWNRFCPFCLEDQFSPVDGDAETDAAAATESARHRSASSKEKDSIGLEFADTVHPGAAEVIPISGPAGKAPNAKGDTGISLAQPSDYWQTEVLGVGGKTDWMARISPKNLKAGIALALVVMAVAFLGARQGYFDTRSDFKVGTERVQTALNRGDLRSAVQLLEAIESSHPDDPTVQSLRDALDLRIQERSTRRSELLDATSRIASNASVSDDSAPGAPETPDAPTSDPLEQATGPLRGSQKECSVALAALALCPKE